MYSYYRQRPRAALVFILVPVLIISFVLVHPRIIYRIPYSDDIAQDPVDSIFSSADGSLPMGTVERTMHDHLRSVSDRYDAARHQKMYGLKLGNITLEGYAQELKDMYNRFFTIDGKSSYDGASQWISPAFRRLSLRPPKRVYPGAPDRIVTTDRDPRQLPEMFGEWKDKMPNTTIVTYDDRGLENWVEDHFGGTELHDIWRRLPRIVLKSDIFRYLVMLVEGGIYADSDTSPLIPASKWGRPYDIGTPDVIRTLEGLISGKPNADADSTSYGATPILDDGSEHGPPALVVGIEFDSIMYRWNWRDIGVSRAVQFTQWVMQARPGHPIFLDVVGRALEKTLKIEKDEAAAKAKGEQYTEEWALEWTGPGVWTDCVYRYLLARYGFLPEMLIGMERPVRIGDVLILPSKRFAAQWPDENGNLEHEFDAVVHGFKGRWRFDDPGVLEAERIKDEKKKAEDARKKLATEKKKAQEAANQPENIIPGDLGSPVKIVEYE